MDSSIPEALKKGKAFCCVRTVPAIRESGKAADPRDADATRWRTRTATKASLSMEEPMERDSFINWTRSSAASSSTTINKVRARNDG